MNKEKSITASCATVDENYTITHCTNGYLIDISGRERMGDYANVKHLVFKHEELIDALIEIDQTILKQRGHF